VRSRVTLRVINAFQVACNAAGFFLSWLLDGGRAVGHGQKARHKERAFDRLVVPPHSANDWIVKRLARSSETEPVSGSRTARVLTTFSPVMLGAPVNNHTS